MRSARVLGDIEDFPTSAEGSQDRSSDWILREVARLSDHEPAEPEPDRTGELVSHFRIRSKLGQGGMGVVYLADDLTLHRSVALKVLPESVVADAKRRRRFLREARSAAAVLHANLATVFEVGESEGTIFIAMEHVEGKLERAYAMVHVHTLGLWSARALEKQGRLAQAAERYLEVATMPVVKGDAPVQAEAREAAARERAAVLPRVPGLRVVVLGVPARAVRVTLDGAAFDTALLGVSVPVNPGPHDVEAEGATRLRRHLVVGEGQRATVIFELSVAPTAEHPTSTTAVARSRSMRLAGAAGLAGVSLARLVAGGVAGGVTFARWSSAQAACPGMNACPSNDAHSLSRGARTSGAVADVAFGMAATSALGAVVLWAAAPARPTPGLVRVDVGASGLVAVGSW